MKQQLSEQDKRVIKHHISGNQNIRAIKYIRQITGLSLKDSKDIFDKFYSNISEIDTFEYEQKGEEITFEDNITENELKTIQLDENEINFIHALLQKGQKIQAVKYVKDKFNYSLKEAKELVDNFDANYKEDKEPETLIFENDDSSIMIEFEPENDLYKIKEITEKEQNINSPTLKKPKSKSFTFGKINRRDRERKKMRSNSGCMLMLSFLFIVSLVIGGMISLVL
ncbi:MAG: hypothetical protein L3J35_12130 [Bacteroidales bacterium]|nr:hypothetical protein [Bacteroidales bacterium]